MFHYAWGKESKHSKIMKAWIQRHLSKVQICVYKSRQTNITSNRLIRYILTEKTKHITSLKQVSIDIMNAQLGDDKIEGKMMKDFGKYIS